MEKSELSQSIRIITGSDPEDITIEDGVASFIINTRQGAMSLVTCDQGAEFDTEYTIVEVTIEDDERGMYGETLFIRGQSLTLDKWFIIEGFYHRDIKSNTTARFEGTIALYENRERFDGGYEEMHQRYCRRTAQKHIDFIKYDLLHLGKIITKIGKSNESEALRREFDEMISETMRSVLCVKGDSANG